jgi:hypothetical protein
MAVSSFYDLFPKINYDIENRRLQPQYEQVTNIFYRLGIVRDVINNIGSYIVYDIEDGDTPEIVAHKVYGDAGGFWLILLANNIMDGQFEWPLDPNSFNQFLIEKYGSIENALITPHHYEKVITRRNTRTGFESVTRFVVNEERLTNNMPDDVPFSYYSPTTPLTDLDEGVPFEATLDSGNLALTGELIQPTIYTINGEPIEIITKGEMVTQFEYETRLNDERRSIKVIKKEYYVQIQDELKAMLSNKPSYIRRVF